MIVNTQLYHVQRECDAKSAVDKLLQKTNIPMPMKGLRNYILQLYEFTSASKCWYRVCGYGVPRDGHCWVVTKNSWQITWTIINGLIVLPA